MIQIIIKYGRPIVLAVTKAAGNIPVVSWIWGTATTINWGTSTPDKLWGVPESATIAVNTNPPSISGTAVVGQTLTAIPGTWTGIATINGNWQRNGVDIVGAKLLNYTLVAADAGNTSNITYKETATNTAGSANATSNTIAQILTARTSAFLTASAITDATIRSALNTLDVGLISNSLDTKMKALYPFVGGTASTHKFNFMNSADTDDAFRLAFSPTGWTHSNTGALPNGTSAFANTFLNPTTSLTTSLGLSYYSRTNANTATDQVDIGVITSLDYFYLTTQYNAGTIVNRFFGRCASASFAINTANADARGYYYLGKTGNGTNLFKSFKNGIIQDTQTGAGVNPNNTVYIGAANVGGSTLYYTNRECAFATISDGLTDSEATNCYTLVQAFQTTLGRQV